MVPKSATAKPSRRRRCRVAIVGAGAAGLSAAQTLLPRLIADGNRPCTSSRCTATRLEPLLILEARDRVGGRIHTAPLPNGLPVDMGAAWVHGTGVPYGHDGRGREEDLNPMVPLLQQRTDLSDDDIQSCKGGKCDDPLKAGLAYTSPRGNTDTRPRDVLHSPAADVSDDRRHLIELHVGGRRIEQNEDNIEKALDLYERILSSVSRIGAAAYDCGEGMATATISIGRTIDVLRSEAPLTYGLGYRIGGDDDNLVETLLGYYLHCLQVWHPHDLANVQLSEFIVDDEGEGDETTHNDEQGGNEGDYHGPHCNVRGGMGSILGPLQSNGVDECILCSQEVTQIEQLWSRNGTEKSTTVVLTCESGTLVEADYCIVTIPIACLKDCVNKPNKLFRPRLSQKKEEAIDMLQMGCYKKVFLIFDDVFWSTGPTLFGLARNEVQEPSVFGESSKAGIGNYLNVDNSIAKDTGKPVLEITLAGGSAQWANGKTTAEIREAVLEFMDESMFVQDGSSFTSRCIGCHVTRWEEDPFSKGAYAGFKLGTLERHAANLAEAEWDGRLFFAGDAIISEYEGSVHGALLSGKEAADKVGLRLDTRSDYIVN